MSTDPKSQEPSIDESLSGLQISQPASIQEIPSDTWQGSKEPSETNVPLDNAAKAQDLPKFDPAAAPGFVPTPEPQQESEPVKHEILDEFDPLVSAEEKAAKEAWQTSESHPRNATPTYAAAYQSTL